MEKLALHSSFLLVFSKYTQNDSGKQQEKDVQQTHGDQRDNTQTDTQGNDQTLFVDGFILMLEVMVRVIVVVVGGWR